MSRQDWITVCQVLCAADHEAPCNAYQRYRRLFPPKKGPLPGVLADIEYETYQRFCERRGWAP